MWMLGAGARGRDAEQEPLCKGRNLYFQSAQAVVCMPQPEAQGQRGKAEAFYMCWTNKHLTRFCDFVFEGTTLGITLENVFRDQLCLFQTGMKSSEGM